MGEALKILVGPDAHGLSASTIARLKQVWAQEYQHWYARELGQDQRVYIWADGIYSGLRAEQTRLCALVLLVLMNVGRSISWRLRMGFVNQPRVGGKCH